MRILLADDHAVVRQGLRMVLSLEKDFEIVGEVSNGSDAVSRAKELQPDLVLMDLKMRGMDGSAATRLIKQTDPKVRVLILTGIEANEEILIALEAGADGYILKEVSPDELVRAIRAIGAGEAYLQPVVTKHLIRKMQTSPTHPVSTTPHTPLTPRECQVLKLMGTSATYKEIAAQLVVSEETVRSHTKNILAKLGQPNRTQAVLFALREGLIDLD